MSAVALPASVTLEQACAVLRSLEAALAADGTGPLRVDASALTELDTSAVALLLQARRLAAADKRGFELIAPPGKLAALARLYGVESLLSIDPSAGGSGSRTASA